VTAGVRNAPLELGDIADVRTYEREREDFRARIIALKRRRRVPVGSFVSLVFGNSETIRFQVQEMVRAERLQTDAAVQFELDTYNALIPEPGHLCATMFIELVSRAEMEEWLPRLVGIERSVELRLGVGDHSERVRGEVDERHGDQLTRTELTAAVHYVRFSLTPAQIEMFGAVPISLAISHSGYRELTGLGPATMASLLEDLLG
jgi:Protein of unknown function (DUF3501)